MKRAIALALLVASVTLLVVVTASASSGHRARHTITVVEHATTDAVTNGSKADRVGNILTFTNKVFNAADKKKVGHDQGYCVRMIVGKSWECMWTTFLKRGQITVEGPFYDDGNSVLAITGGTDHYRDAHGQMKLKYHNKAGTKFDFVFRLSH
jgi:allene oxide cyclase